MTVKDFFSELVYPLRSTSTLVALITFYLLWGLANLAGLLGIWLLVMVVPALCRYQVMIAEARARGTDAEPPGIEFFSFAGNWWTLFPVIPTVLFLLGLREVQQMGDTAVIVYSIAAALLLPAMMSVLVITHSPLQALNPLGWFTVIQRVGSGYLFAPLLLIGIGVMGAELSALPGWLETFVDLYLTFAFYAVIGASIRDQQLIDDVDIPDAAEPDVDKQVGDLQKQRTGVLNHAYGFVSRGNREGGLSHIYAWLTEDPDPDAAWRWFFEQMLEWDDRDHALYFAQQYISRLLARGDAVQAVKLIMRGRLLNERFRPASADLPAAIDAAESLGNTELAESLRRL